jgi:hypothetical protein
MMVIRRIRSESLAVLLLILLRSAKNFLDCVKLLIAWSDDNFVVFLEASTLSVDGCHAATAENLKPRKISFVGERKHCVKCEVKVAEKIYCMEFLSSYCGSFCPFQPIPNTRTKSLHSNINFLK